MHIKRFIVGMMILWHMSYAGHVSGEETAEYLPLVDGNFWTYSVTGTCGTYNKRVTVLQGSVIINGEPTKALQTTGGPDGQGIEYWTSDNNGIRVHGAFVPSTEIGPARLYFDPPMVAAKSTMSINETVSSSGEVTFVFDLYGTYVLNYKSASTLAGVEAVDVPAGTYDAVKILDSIRIYGSILNQPYDDTSASTTWLAKHIGVIKDIYTDADCDEVYNLISTNVKPPSSTRLLPFLPLLLD